MKLYTSPTTPFGRKIAVLLHEKSLLDRVAMTLVAGTPLDAGSLPVQHNPLGKIPTLVLADGSAIYDSRVIARFLNDHFDLGVYPKGDALWPALTAEAAIDGMIEAAVLMAYEIRLRPVDMLFQPWLDAQWLKITRTLDMFEQSPQAEGFNMPQIALGCALSYLDFRHDVLGWRTGRPYLATWFEGISARPSMKMTGPTVT